MKKDKPGNVIRFNKAAGDRPSQKQIAIMRQQLESLIRSQDHRALVALVSYLHDANTPPEAS